MKVLRNQTIRYKILIYFTILIIAPFSIMLVLQYRLSTGNLTKNLSENTNQMIAQIENSLDFYILEIENLSEIVGKDEDVLGFMAYDQHKSFNEVRIRKMLSAITTAHPEIVGIMLLNGGDAYISNEMYRAARDPLTSEGWYQSALANPEGMTLISRPIGRNIRSYHDYASDDVVSAIIPITLPHAEAPSGVIVIDMSLAIIDALIEDITLGTNGFIFIVGDRDTIIFTPENPITHRIDTRHFQGRDKGNFALEVTDNVYNVFFTTSGYTQWKTVGVFQDKDIYAEVQHFRNYMLIIGFMTIVLAAFFASLIDRSVSTPLAGLKDAMKTVESGNLEVTYEWSSEDEIGQLSQNFNHMVREIKELINLVEMEQRQIVDAELRVLQAQIKPHFLYNTLDTIIWLSREQGADEITEVTTALSSLFRIGLSKGKEFIAFKDELTHVTSYLLIQKARYEEDLNYEIICDDGLKDLTILKLILQPIVENAIYHGIKEKDSPGKITLFTTIDDGDLLIHVTDDGVGMPPDTHRALVSQLANPLSKSTLGYGLQNIQKRIQLHFGSTYGLTLHSIPGEGTEVIIRHPLIQGER